MCELCFNFPNQRSREENSNSNSGQILNQSIEQNKFSAKYRRYSSSNN